MNVLPAGVSTRERRDGSPLSGRARARHRDIRPRRQQGLLLRAHGRRGAAVAGRARAGVPGADRPPAGSRAGVRRARLLLLPLLDELLRHPGGAAQEPAGADRRARPRALPAPVPRVLQAAGGDRLQYAGGEGPDRARDRQPGPAGRGGRHRHRAAGRDPRRRGGPAARPAGRLLRLRRPHRAREGLRRDDRPLPALAAGDALEGDARALRPQHDELLGERARAPDGRRARTARSWPRSPARARSSCPRATRACRWSCSRPG